MMSPRSQPHGKLFPVPFPSLTRGSGTRHASPSAARAEPSPQAVIFGASGEARFNFIPARPDFPLHRLAGPVHIPAVKSDYDGAWKATGSMIGPPKGSVFPLHRHPCRHKHKTMGGFIFGFAVS